jgi:type IV pilus assembly protein PilB
VAQARNCAGLPGAEVALHGSGSFLRLYRKPHLDTDQWRREDGEDLFSFGERPRSDRVVHFGLESHPAPGGEALRITLRPATTAEETRFNLGFAREAEGRFIRAARARFGIVLLTGPCNSGKSTATYRLLSLLRDEGRNVITVEWPVEWKLRGVEQHDLGDGLDAYDRVGPCLKEAVRARPDVILLQNIDWVNEEDASAAIDFAAGGGLLITAVHSRGCVCGLADLLRRRFIGRRLDAAELLRVVVSPRRLSMVCAQCAEEYPVPARMFTLSGMAAPPTGRDGKVSTWRGRGCPRCEGTGTWGSTAVYEVLDLTGKMRRFLENRNDWDGGQQEYLERQAWQHGMRTQREMALERVVAGDISLQEALLNTAMPHWLPAAQAQKRDGCQKGSW